MKRIFFIFFLPSLFFFFTTGISQEKDTDQDGLTDFHEIHKYCTNPNKKDSDQDGVLDNEGEERLEFTYSIKTTILVMPPFNKKALTDDFQDVTIVEEKEDYIKLEVIHFPLNTINKSIPEHFDWQKRNQHLVKFLKPRLTCNWDSKMQQQLLKELAKDNIFPTKLSDKAFVEKVARWAMKTTQYRSEFFSTYYIDFSNQIPAIYPGLEAIVEQELAKNNWNFSEQLAHEVLGREMFYNKTRGSCTSSSIYLTTLLRALNIPTRMIIAIPLVDASDPHQLELLQKNISHHWIRNTIYDGVRNLKDSFVAHTFNEVYLGDRWIRLNYSTLGQNILDKNYFGLLTHVHTFLDLSEANLASTWGKRYGLKERNNLFQRSNPYKTVAISDRFGVHSKIENPKIKEHQIITISKAYWPQTSQYLLSCSKEEQEYFMQPGIFLVHGEEWFAEQNHLQYKKFMEKADRRFYLTREGVEPLTVNMTLAFFTNSNKNIREMALEISPTELKKMNKGLPYLLIPRNQNKNFLWKMKKVFLYKDF